MRLIADIERQSIEVTLPNQWGQAAFLTCEDADGSIQAELSHLIGPEGWLAPASYYRLDVLH